MNIKVDIKMSILMLQYFTVVWNLYLASIIIRISLASHKLSSYGYFTTGACETSLSVCVPAVT
jgi:hypothetical protein